MRESTAELAGRVRRGEGVALGRLITRLVRDPALLGEVVTGRDGGVGVGALGITGPPGAGKSSLISALLTNLRERGKRVAVLCVDPSSPFSQGAVLGDRIRMGAHGLDQDVFIRSFATRGQLGGLARGIPAAASLLADVGYDEVIIETVGVGQNETSISRLAQTSMLVLSPGTGDSIQAIKSGIIEVADVIAVNKSDLDGAKEAAHQLKQNIVADRRGWRPPVLTVGALAGQGIDELWQAVDAHREFCAAHRDVDGHPEGWLPPRIARSPWPFAR